MTEKKPSQRRYPPELRERAVRMVGELRHQDPNDTGVLSRVVRRLGVGTESLRTWVKQGEVDTGARPGLNTAEHDELVEPRKEVKELRRANEYTSIAHTERLRDVGAASSIGTVG